MPTKAMHPMASSATPGQFTTPPGGRRWRPGWTRWKIGVVRLCLGRRHVWRRLPVPRRTSRSATCRSLVNTPVRIVDAHAVLFEPFIGFVVFEAADDHAQPVPKQLFILQDHFGYRRHATHFDRVEIHGEPVAFGEAG